jgi:hypothetical protein
MSIRAFLSVSPNIRVFAAVKDARVATTVYFRNIEVSNIYLNSIVKNRYIRDDAVIPLEELSVNFSKTVGDTYSVTDTIATGFAKVASDAVSTTDAIDVLLVLNRQYSDDVAVSDVATLAVNKAAADTVTIDEVIQIASTKLLSDLTTVADSTAIALSKPAEDSVSVGDTLAVATTFYRTFTDTVTVSEAIGFGDTEFPVDNIGVADEAAKNLQKVASDGVGVTELISVTVESTKLSSTLNANAFNTTAFNN